MEIDLAALPDDVDTLRRVIGDLVAERDNERAEAQAEIDRLRRLVKTLQRSQFGRRSERLDHDQLQLGLEDLDADIARAEAGLPEETPSTEAKPARGSDGRLSLAKLDKFDCLILDDLGYVRKDQAKTAVLFEQIAERYERKSLIITCNQPFSEWNQIFPDPGVTVAAIDRLVHHSTILEINTESYRRRTAAQSSATAKKTRAKVLA